MLSLLINPALMPKRTNLLQPIGELRPQQHDHVFATLAKINECLARNLISRIIYDFDGRPMVVQRAFVNAPAATAEHPVVAAVDGYGIRVIAWAALAGADGADLTFNSDDDPISPLWANDGKGGEVMQRNPDGWFETLPGEPLTVTTGAGASTGILVHYVLTRAHLMVGNDGLVVVGNDGWPVVLNN